MPEFGRFDAEFSPLGKNFVDQAFAETKLKNALLIDAINQTGRNCSLEKPPAMHYLGSRNRVHQSTNRRI
ncbi:MAG: hypothetical protein ACOVQ0_04150 [Novosphingobium sp.]|uniref:hypothetical protein n=1 Tax=Novosphingobium sp. TaxID=1874826 RepID=UPI003B9C7F6A